MVADTTRAFLFGVVLMLVGAISAAAAVVVANSSDDTPCTTDQLIAEIIATSRPNMGSRERDFWNRSIQEAAAAEGAPPVILAALVDIESGFKGRLTSHKGAKGAAQVMDVWREQCKNPDLMEIEPNLRCGANVLAHYMNDGGLEGGLRRYVAGPKNESGAQWYADKVLARVASASVKVCRVPGTKTKELTK